MLDLKDLKINFSCKPLLKLTKTKNKLGITAQIYILLLVCQRVNLSSTTYKWDNVECKGWAIEAHEKDVTLRVTNVILTGAYGAFTPGGVHVRHDTFLELNLVKSQMTQTAPASANQKLDERPRNHPDSPVYNKKIIR